MTYTVVLRGEPEGGYTVLVPTLRPVVSYGRDVGEAQRCAEEAILALIESRVQRGDPVPEEDPATPLVLEPHYLFPPGVEYDTAEIVLTRVSVSVPAEEAAVA